MNEPLPPASDLAFQEHLRHLVRGRTEAVLAAGRDNMVEAIRAVGIEEPCANLEIAIALCLTCRDALSSPTSREALVHRGAAWLASQGLRSQPDVTLTVPLSQTAGAGSDQRVVTKAVQARHRATEDGRGHEHASDSKDHVPKARGAGGAVPDRPDSQPERRGPIRQGKPNLGRSNYAELSEANGSDVAKSRKKLPNLERESGFAGLSALTAAKETLALISKLALERMHSIAVAESEISAPSRVNVPAPNSAIARTLDDVSMDSDNSCPPNEEAAERTPTNNAPKAFAAVYDSEVRGEPVKSCPTPTCPDEGHIVSVAAPDPLAQPATPTPDEGKFSELETFIRQQVSRTGRGQPPPNE